MKIMEVFMKTNVLITGATGNMRDAGSEPAGSNDCSESRRDLFIEHAGKAA